MENRKRVYQRQRKRVHRGDNWETIRLKDIPDKGLVSLVAPTYLGGKFSGLRRVIKDLPPGEIIYTASCRYRVIEE